MQIKLHIWSCLSVCPKLFVQIFKQGSLKRLFDSVILFGKSLAGKGGRGHNWQHVYCFLAVGGHKLFGSTQKGPPPLDEFQNKVSSIRYNSLSANVVSSVVK